MEPVVQKSVWNETEWPWLILAHIVMNILCSLVRKGYIWKKKSGHPEDPVYMPTIKLRKLANYKKQCNICVQAIVLKWLRST